jgi:adenylate cyclase
VGHITAAADRDGVHRRVPLLIRFTDRYVPSLSLAALASYLNVEPKNIAFTKSGSLSIKRESGVLEIPLERDGSLTVNWPYKEESFPHYPATDLLDEEGSPRLKDRYKGKVVIIAYSATGTTDIGNNPLFKQFLLSRIHSSALNTMLTRQFVTLIDEFPLVVPLAALVSIAFFIVCLSIRHRYAIILELAICSLYGLIVLIPFVWWSYDIPTSAPLLLFAVSATTFLVSRAISMESRADRVAGALQRYLSPQMLKSIVDLDHEIDLSTRRKELTILFVDIKGFTTMSETVEVEYLEGFLNDFLEAMTSAIFDCHGTVDKFLGDGLLAFFGDPIELENHALAAICAAEQMHKEMKRLNEKWSATGIPEFADGMQIRIGINTGMVVVGNVGSPRRMEYTVIGSAVNVASRLEQAAPPGKVLVSARTYSLARDYLTCKAPETIRVKGVERPITVCEIESVRKDSGSVL